MPKEFSIDEIRDSLHVDLNDLDNVVVRQIDLYDYICKRFYAAISARDTAKVGLKDADAEALLEVRTTAEKNGVKTTEATVAALVQQHTKHIEAVEALLEAEREYNDWASLKDSFNQRSQLMGILSDLYKTGYFVRTSISASNSQENYEMARERMKNARIERRKFTT